MTAAVVYPLYECGEDFHDDRYHVTEYGPADKVTPESLGLPRGQASMSLRITAPDSRADVHVPTAALRADQDYVYERHVRNLVNVPVESLQATHDWDPILVWRLKDGTYLIAEGHHRSCAAILRGDDTVLVTISGVEA